MTPARIAAIAALLVVVVALAIVLLGGGGHKYSLVFQNAAQLVPDNQVLIGGQPVGSVESIELTDDNLARVEIEIDQELHEGSTAVIRATSLAGVANHYVSISPGPNSNPSLDDGAQLGLDETTTPVDLDQLLNTFPASVRRGLGEFIRGTATSYAGRGKDAHEAFKYFGPALNRTGAFVGELNADQRLLERFIVSSSKLATTVAARGENLSSAFANADTAFSAIASQNEAFSQTLRLLPPVFRQSNTTFVNLRAALDDLDPLVETSKTATKDLAPFLRELQPFLARAVPVFHDLRLVMHRPGPGNDTGDTFAALPSIQQQASRAFSHAEAAIEDFLPNLRFTRTYAPDLLNGFGKLGQLTANYDANGHYARALIATNIFSYDGGSGQLKPLPVSGQYNDFGSFADVRRPCPGGASQPTPDGSSPFTEPPFAGADVSPSECDPADAPPGP